MYAFGNHIHVSSVEEHLTTKYNGAVATFEQLCVFRPNDQQPILAKLEYVGWVEEILEFNYGVLKKVVLLCKWVKTNYIGSNVIVKRDNNSKFQFRDFNFKLIIYFPNICRASIFL
jgi:hypothetical protein